MRKTIAGLVLNMRKKFTVVGNLIEQKINFLPLHLLLQLFYLSQLIYQITHLSNQPNRTLLRNFLFFFFLTAPSLNLPYFYAVDCLSRLALNNNYTQLIDHLSSSVCLRQWPVPGIFSSASPLLIYKSGISRSFSPRNTLDSSPGPSSSILVFCWLHLFTLLFPTCCASEIYMQVQLRAAQGHIHESISRNRFQLFNCQLVLSDRLVNYHQRILVYFGLLSSLPHFQLQFSDLAMNSVTSTTMGSFSDMTLAIVQIYSKYYKYAQEIKSRENNFSYYSKFKRPMSYFWVVSHRIFLAQFPLFVLILNGNARPKREIIFKQIMNEEYGFSKLAEIKRQASTERSQFNTIGVIVDSTNPHRKDAKKDYCLKLKIIDSTSASDPCHVFLYSKHLQDFPQNIKLGDILMLNKYGFEVWQNSLQAKKQFKVMGAEFRFFSGDPSLDNYSPIGQQATLDDFDGSILNSIKQLRKFSQHEFKKNNIPLYTKKSKLASDFDLILEVKSTQKLNQGYKIFMTNTVNDFEINYNYDQSPGVYKVRSIADFSWNGKKCILVGNDYTCFLEIPTWMKSHDPKEWEKLVAVKNAAESKGERERLETKILNEKRGEKRKEVKLSQLVTQDIHSEEVAVVCQFVECFTSFGDALRRYDSHNHTEKRYESSQGEYIYSIHYAITDDSLKGELFNVYVYTYDKRGLEFLPDLHPDKIFGRNILSFQQKYDHINNRLLEQTDIERDPLKIVLSPMTNGKDTIYRIVDTELLI